MNDRDFLPCHYPQVTMKFFFKRVLPTREFIYKNKFLSWILNKVGNSQMFQINRHAIAGGISVGVFFGALPIPLQIPCALFCAACFRLNVITAALGTLYSNPITYAPLFYFNYRVGEIFFKSSTATEVNMDLSNLGHLGGNVLMPLFSGSVVVGVVLSATAYFSLYFAWQWSVWSYLKERQKRFLNSEKDKNFWFKKDKKDK